MLINRFKMLTGKLRGCVAAIILAVLRFVELARGTCEAQSAGIANVVHLDLAPVFTHSATLHFDFFSLSQFTSAL